MKNFLPLFCAIFAMHSVPAQRVPFSLDKVHIPSELAPLTDMITTKTTCTGKVVSTWIRRTVNGRSESKPVFVYTRQIGPNDLITAVDLATAFLEQTDEVVTQTANTVQFGETVFTFNASGGGARVNVIDAASVLQRVMLNGVGTPTLNKPLSQQLAIIGSGFTPTHYTKSGTGFFEYIPGVSERDTAVSVLGIVTRQRVIQDCQYAQMRSPKGIILTNPYPYNNVNDLTTTYSTEFKRGADDQVRSVFPYLVKVENVIYNNTWVNGKLYNEVGPLKNAAGYSFSPTWIIRLCNQPPLPTVLTDADYVNGAGFVNQRIQLRQFDQMNIATTTGEGYIDERSNTIYYNPSKRCVIWVQYSNARMGDPNAKTYNYECFALINPDGTITQSRLLENLPQ
jgi:hypothetical protein